jgi:hypothetical protein
MKMADEKAMLSQWNTAFKKKLDKRTAAPAVTPEAGAEHVAVLVSAPAPTPGFDFFATWAAYYPRLVSLLGWGSLILPRKVSDILKALLSFVNDPLIPFAKEMLKKTAA